MPNPQAPGPYLILMTLGQAEWEGQALGPQILSSKPLHGGAGGPVNDKAHPGSQSTATPSEGH